MGQQFGGGIGPLAPLGKAISRQLNVKRQPEIQEFMGEVKDMANQRFEIDLGAVGQRPMFNQTARPAVIDLMEQQKLTLDTAQEPVTTSEEVQEYKDGGAAFPDLSGDGKITQKDILIGRGVIEKQYGGPIGMEAGGPPLGEGMMVDMGYVRPSKKSASEIPPDPTPDATLNNVMKERRKQEGLNEFNQYLNAIDMTYEEFTNKPVDFQMDVVKMLSPSVEATREILKHLYDAKKSVKGMQMGGDPMTAPPMPMPAPEQPPMPMQDQLDPNVVQSALAQAAGGIGDLDQAQNYEQVMNTMRGDQATVEERREELAGVVGPGDANQTPESVLTLVQPVMMLANVDQGIGQLAQQEMTQPMEGPMAGGIMSTVPEPPMMEAGGTAPVNFNKGGEVRPVQYFQNAGLVSGGEDPFANLTGRTGQLTREAFDLRRSLLGDPADLKKQKDLTKAQILFDIASAGLAFAAPMEGERPGLSAAERLALAAQKTQLPERISARAQSQLEREQQAKQADKAIMLSAIEQGEAARSAEKTIEANIALQKMKDEASEKELKIKNAHELSKMKTKDILDTQRDLTVQADLFKKKENLAQKELANTKELEKFKGVLSINELERKAELEAIAATIANERKLLFEEEQQANRKVLEGTKYVFERKLIDLRAEKDTISQAAKNDFQLKLAEINSQLRVNELGVKSSFAIAEMKIGHEQATEINNTNNALKKELALLDNEIKNRSASVQEKRLKLDQVNSKIANAQGAQKIKLQEEKLDLERDIADYDKNYKNKKLDIEAEAARLSRLGSSTDARITTLISDPERLTKYAMGTLGAPETLELNQAIAYYTQPKQKWNDEYKIYEMKPGNPLSTELKNAIEMRKNNGLTIPSTLQEKEEKKISGIGDIPEKTKNEVKSLIMEGVRDPAAAFGSDSALANATNKFIEFATLGFVGAPFKKTKEALAAVQTLNTRTVQVFQDAADLRDSVAQLNLLIKLTPSPANTLAGIFVGDDEAHQYTKSMLGLIGEAKAKLTKKLEEYPLESKAYTEAKSDLDSLLQIEAGYTIMKNSFEKVFQPMKKLEAVREYLFGPPEEEEVVK
ncbi:MAG: hypothetical protein CME98_22545 [Hyphomonas sp.]|nr:hypothetical protein [Hyphomonas sp.]